VRLSARAILPGRRRKCSKISALRCNRPAAPPPT
jgi:hypothetical protein